MYNEKIFDFSDQKFTSDASEVFISSNRKGGRSVSCGYLSKPLKFSGKNEHSIIFDLGGKFSTTRDTLISTGNNIFNQGVFTRQYYKGGGYTTFDLSTRIVSGLYNKSTIMENIENVLIMLSPRYISTKEAVGGLKTALKETTEFGIKSSKNVVKTGTGLFKDAFNGEFKNMVDTVGIGAVNQTNLLINSINNLDTSDHVFSVKIGKYFNWNEMIIKDYTATLSRELDNYDQPLYVDLTFTVQSREVLTEDDVSSFFGKGTGTRVTYKAGKEDARGGNAGGYKPVTTQYITQ